MNGDVDDKRPEKEERRGTMMQMKYQERKNVRQ